MGTSYSFNMDRYNLEKRVKLLRNGAIIYLVNLFFLFIISMIYLNESLGSAQVYSIWVLDLVNFGLTLSSSILFIIGSQGIINNVLPKDQKLAKFVKTMHIIFIALYSFIGLIFTIIIPFDDSRNHLIMIKNLLLIFVLSIALLGTSFLFNRIQHIGYKTRMLYTPMIFLPMPAFAGFFMGFFITGSSIFSGSSDDAVRITVQILFVYLVLCLIATYIEFLVVITPQMQDLERSTPRRRAKKNT